MVPIFLEKISMNGDGWEAVFSEYLIKFNGVLNALDENNDLIEHKGIKQVSQLSDLLVFLELNIELFKSMESELAFAVNKDLILILHEFSADVLDISRHSG